MPSDDGTDRLIAYLEDEKEGRRRRWNSAAIAAFIVALIAVALVLRFVVFPG